MAKRYALTAMALGLTLAGCAVGPDYKRPATPEPTSFAHANTASSTPAAAAGDAEFWRSFGDPELRALVERALATNQDLRASLARYDSANALLREDKFDRYPTVTATGQAGHQEVSRDQSFGFARDYRTYSASANASWELDVVGRVRREVESQRTETAASAADVAALQISIVGEVASTYVELRGLQERLRVARDNAANQTQTLQLVQARLDAGQANELDMARIRSQLESTLSRVPALEARVAVDEHRLAVLIGQAPEALIAELDTPKPLPDLPGWIDPGTPADLLRRRPDVAAAEDRLHAATARVGVATADLFPRFTLLGALGTQANQHKDLGSSGSRTSLIAMGIDWSFLDVGRVRARIAASRADAAVLLAQYQQAVLQALQDTEDALVTYDRTLSEDAHLRQAAQDSAEAAHLARLRYEAGAIDLYEVLDAERTMLTAQDAFADVHARSASAAVGLYRSLAGGWPQKSGMTVAK